MKTVKSFFQTAKDMTKDLIGLGIEYLNMFVARIKGPSEALRAINQRDALAQGQPSATTTIATEANPWPWLVNNFVTGEGNDLHQGKVYLGFGPERPLYVYGIEARQNVVALQILPYEFEGYRDSDITIDYGNGHTERTKVSVLLLEPKLKWERDRENFANEVEKASTQAEVLYTLKNFRKKFVNFLEEEDFQVIRRFVKDISENPKSVGIPREAKREILGILYGIRNPYRYQETNQN